MSVALVLSGETDSTDGPSVKKYESSNGSIRLDVNMPRRVDDEQANHLAALLFEQMDQLPENAVVERVKLSTLRFTPAGVQSFREFFSMHAATTTHVSLKNINKENATDEGSAVFDSLVQTFQESKIEILNLSDNVINASTWDNFNKQQSIRQLLLDQVEMDDQSIIAMSNSFSCFETLEDLYVVLTKPAGEIAVMSVSDILADCKSVTSVRWAYRTPSVECKLPWFGLRQMVNCPAVAPLRHLVLDGALISVSEIATDGLCGALRKLLLLKTLKLRDIGLRDNGVRSVISALKLSQPPLQWLDLSGNMIETEGAQSIAQLASQEKIVSNLEVLALDRNKICIDAGSMLIEAFASIVKDDVDIRLEGNPINFSRMAVRMVRAKLAAEKNLQRVQNERCVEPSATPLEIQMLQSECEQHKREKDVLAQAFSIIGVSREVNETRLLMDRVARLEANTGGSGHSRSKTPSRATLNRQASVPACFDTPTSCATTVSCSTPLSNISGGSGDRLRAPNLANMIENRHNNNSSSNRRSSMSSAKSASSKSSDYYASGDYYGSGASVSTNSFSKLQRSQSIDRDILLSPDSSDPHQTSSYGKFSRSCSTSTRMNTIPDDSDHTSVAEDPNRSTRSIRVNSYCNQNGERIPVKEHVAKISSSNVRPEVRKMKSRKALTRLTSRQRLLEPKLEGEISP